MAAPDASLRQEVIQRFFGPVFLALAITHCAHPQGTPDSTKLGTAPPVEWYIAQHDPLTYCPKGHKLPPPRVAYGPAPAYVYLADRTTRFYIPPHAELHRKQALKLRKLSKSETQSLPPNVSRTMRWVSRALARTAVTSVVAAAMMIGGAPQEDSIAANALEAVWAEDD